MKFDAREHRYIRIPEVMDWISMGWVPLPSLDGTSHGRWSVHCVWICACPPPALRRVHD